MKRNKTHGTLTKRHPRVILHVLYLKQTLKQNLRTEQDLFVW